MKTIFLTRFMVIGTLLAPMAPMVAIAADSDTDRSSPMTYVKDSVITTKIKTELAAAHITSLGRIHVNSGSRSVGA